MPNTETSVLGVNPTQEWMSSDVPGGDTPFAELFSADEAVTTDTPTTAEVKTTSQEASQAQAQQAEEFFLKAGTSVYKSKEAVEKGIQEKDALIEQLRQQYILERGIDPVTRQPVRVGGEPQGPASYLQDPKKYMRDLAEAANKMDEEAYFRTQSQLVFDLLSPIAPLITDFARTKAVETVATEVKDFRTFIGSEDYTSVLSQNPALKNAIEGAEQDVRFHGELPQLYKIAYLTSQGSKVPELIRAAQQAAQTQAQQQARPTQTPSAIAPPTGAKPDWRTSDGRKAIIKNFEDQGLGDVKF
jgi:hypothetical protein